MKILLGMSGGVDSAVAVKRLLDRGHDVEGAILLMHEYSELEGARRAAEELGVKLHVLDVQNSFNYIIKKNFVDEYCNGRTPNPCIVCNEKVKFRYLYDYAMENGFEAIATGHYAKVVKIEDEESVRYSIAVAEDKNKDQSYMLYRLSQDVLSRLILPMSDITKDSAREVARNSGISSAEKKDSQEICFLPDGNHAEYIESVIGKVPCGNFVDEKGAVLGTHNGIVRYTVGQRKGLGISLGERAFVTEINPVENTVVLSPKYQGKRSVRIRDIRFLGVKELSCGESVTANIRVRYTAPMVIGKAVFDGENGAEIFFETPVKAAPGQSAVAYDADGVILFGGFIM